MGLDMKMLGMDMDGSTESECLCSLYVVQWGAQENLEPDEDR